VTVDDLEYDIGCTVLRKDQLLDNSRFEYDDGEVGRLIVEVDPHRARALRREDSRCAGDEGPGWYAVFNSQLSPEELESIERQLRLE
jgi:hypothetical protein